MNISINSKNSLFKKNQIIKPEGIIFDWDNTLVDTWPVIHYALNQTMTKMNKELWSLDKVKKDVHRSMRESFPEIFGEKWQEAGEIYINSYKEKHLEKLQFLPNAENLIDFLYKKEVPLFLISNKIGETLRNEAEFLKVNNKFFSIIGSKDSAFDKPNKAPVDMALQKNSIKPENDLVWFVGDTITDIECAINSDCQPVLYGHGINVSKELIAKEAKKESKPLIRFINHQEILEKIEPIF